MNDLGKELEAYVMDFSTPEAVLLTELTRQTHLKILQSRMLSGHIQGQLLAFIVALLKPNRILEIGTYTGYSALCMASALVRDSGIDTIEINDELEPFIRSFIDKSEFGNRIHLHFGDALEIIPSLNHSYDLVFMDGDKREYVQYYELIINRLNKGGVILADNVLWSGKVVEPLDSNDNYTKGILEFNTLILNDSRVENFILPLRDGINIIRKL